MQKLLIANRYRAENLNILTILKSTLITLKEDLIRRSWNFQIWQHKINQYASMKKKKPNPKERTPATKLRSNSNSHMHVKQPSTATWVELTTSTKLLSFCHKTGNNGKTKPWCWLAQQSLQEREGEAPKTKEEREAEKGKNWETPKRKREKHDEQC